MPPLFGGGDILGIEIAQDGSRAASNGTQRLKPTRVLLVAMARMQIDIVKNILAAEEGIVVAGEVSGQAEMANAVAVTKANVVVTGEVPAGDVASYRRLLYRRPRLRIVAITAEGRPGRTYELQPHVATIVDLSPTSLIAAIKGLTPWNDVVASM